MCRPKAGGRNAKPLARIRSMPSLPQSTSRSEKENHMRVIQVNMHRSRVANDLLSQFVHEKEVDIVLISEQYKDKNDHTHWYPDSTSTAAIWVPNCGKRQVRRCRHGRGFVWLECDGITFFSCYLTPNESSQDFREKLNNLEDEVRRRPGHIVVAGDFNAKAINWGMPYTDARGRSLLDMAARVDLLTINTGATPTFRRPGYAETIPDVTFATATLASKIERWEVLEDYTASDHQYITFEVQEGPPKVKIAYTTSPKWNIEKMDVDSFAEVLKWGAEQIKRPRIEGREAVEGLAEIIMGVIAKACDASMPRKKPRHAKPPVYWWTPEIANLRRHCYKLRRRAQREKRRSHAKAEHTAYRTARKVLRTAINQSKALCWRKLVEDINSDPWGMGYKIVTQKLGAMKPSMTMEAPLMEKIVKALFPTHPERKLTDRRGAVDIPLFTVGELNEAVLSMKARKAPGPDGIPSEALKVVVRQIPELMLEMLNKCLETGIFCTRWKVGRLVLVSKGKGNPEEPTSYRPLCMLDTAGKVLEKLIRARLGKAIKAAGDLSPQQYGFRSGLSTVDAILQVTEAVRCAEDHSHHSRRVVLLVTLDVKNAFNSARWCDMINALEKSFKLPTYLLRILEDYLRNRVLVYDTKEGQRRVAITAGAAQGSILGPDLWNAVYDGLLHIKTPDETRLIAYADDVAVLVAARNVEMAQIKLNRVMRSIINWMADHGLSLALSKTEVLLLTKKRIPTIFPVRVGEETVATKPVVKYLGIMIDSKLSFLDQIQRAADKAATRIRALSRLMANVGGPRSSKRRLLMSSTQSVLLYGAEVWADALRKNSHKKRIAQVQRQSALRVCSAYRTVSEPAVLIIAGVVPIKLLARERKAVHYRKKLVGKDVAAREERARTMVEWQRTWESETRGRWTFRLIKDLSSWVDRSHGEIGYYLTQFLSAHGYYRKYLHRMGKHPSPDCPYCPGLLDDPEHTFFVCARWTRERLGLIQEIGQISPDSIVASMLRGKEQWILVARYVERILRAKKVDMDMP